MKKTIDKIKVAFLKQFRHIKIYKWPMFIVFNPHTFSVKGEQYYIAKKMIKKGDIILRSYIQYLDSYFIPGEYSHAALYLGDDKIIHAMTPDVQYTDLATFMRCDSFCIIRPNVSDDDIQLAIDRAESKLGVKYDYDFVFEQEDESEERTFSCAELCFYAYQKNLKELDWKIKTLHYGVYEREALVPEDLMPTKKSCASLIYKV